MALLQIPYTYDNKKNPLREMFPNNFKFKSWGEGVILNNGLSKNNVISKGFKIYNYTYEGNLPKTVTYNDGKTKETLFYKK